MKEQFISMIPKDLNVCLLGLQGSRALGFAETKDADYDYRGVFVAKNEDLLSMNSIKETIEINMGCKDDDAEFVFHEVGKFFRLAMKGNPSVLSLFFVPKWNLKSDIGDMIIKNKDLFLSDNAIRNAFGGYAMSQILYLKRNSKFKDGRKIGKHIKHCFRLFDQGQELLETGRITILLENPQKYIDISKERNMDKLFRMFEERDREFRSCKSVLGDELNEYMINKLLLKIRGF